MRVVGRIDLEENGLTEWESDCDACGTWQAWSRDPQTAHTVSRHHVAHCPAHRLQHVLDELRQAVDLLDRWADGDLLVVAPHEMTLHLVGRAAGSRRASGLITDLLARHGGAS